jgi:uncharacterized membrane protein
VFPKTKYPTSYQADKEKRIAQLSIFQYDAHEGVTQMRYIIILAVIGLLVGVGVGQGIKLISSHVEGKLRACAFSCILGVVAMMVMLIAGYFLYFGAGTAVHSI